MGLLDLRLTTVPSRVDLRDHVYKRSGQDIPDEVDLRTWDSPVDNQYQLGSCVGNAIASAYEAQVRRLRPQEFVELSRLFIYYNAREIYGLVDVDTGTSVRAGLQAVRLYGVCAESIWPYDLTMFDDRPTDAAYADAETRTISSYRRLYTDLNVMDALASNYPVVVAITVFSDFMTLAGADATVPMPGRSSVEYGGHALCLVGYSRSRSAFLAKNSFGTEWGDQGYCWIPFAYAARYVFEKWVFDISPGQVTGASTPS